MIFDKDFWSEIILSVKKSKIRSGLTAFGVFWGIFLLVLMLGISRGLNNGFQKNFQGIATNSAFIWAQQTSKPYKGYNRGKYWTLTTEDIINIKNKVPEIEYIMPRLEGWKTGNRDNTVFGTKSGNFNIKGDYPTFQKVDPVTIVHGRFINELDIINKRKICLIGNRVSEVLFGTGVNPVGNHIKIYNSYYKVVGTFYPRNRMEFGGNKNEAIYIPFTTLQIALNMGNKINYFAFTAKKGIPIKIVESKIFSVLKQDHKIAPSDDSAIGHINLEKIFNNYKSLFSGIYILTWIVGIGTLLAGVIGISNVMLVSVKERTHEIGIYRAIGATPKDIISQIIAESVLINFFSGYLGLSFSLALLELLNKILSLTADTETNRFFEKTDVPLTVCLSIMLILLITGTIAGVLPAIRAVKTKTINALKEMI